MSDMNLPTVTVENDGTTVGPFYVTEDEVHEIVSYEDPGTYALVPVDAVEKVWLCSVQRAVFVNMSHQCKFEHTTADCGWRWLVSGEEEE